jgi:hypothetical protein
MTSPQDDGRVLGLTRGIVLAYTIPGASKLIAYRLENNNINFNNINFIADRYQLDGSLSDNYNTATNRFYTSKEATFDVLANVNDIDLYTGDVAVDVDLSTTITLSEEPAIGFGWRISEKQVNTLSNIPEGTTVVSVDGNVVTVNKPVTLSTGDQILFDGTASATYAVSVPFDSINGRFRAQVPFIDGVKTYEAGETILFIQQELYDGYTGTNDGWTRVKDWLMADGLDVDLYDDYEIIPGFAEKALDPTVVNQRAGIWQISFDSDGIVLLNCIQEIILTQVVQIASGTSHAGTFMMYDENPKPGFTVPAYSPQDALQSSSTDRTRFDGSNTRFYDHRDNYAEPETGDKYIKFTQFGVYK